MGEVVAEMSMMFLSMLSDLVSGVGSILSMTEGGMLEVVDNG
jgi:hypothetical protein